MRDDGDGVALIYIDRKLIHEAYSPRRSRARAPRTAQASLRLSRRDSRPPCPGSTLDPAPADLEAARAIARIRGGQEIDNTIAKVIRAVPFPPLNSVAGPQGKRWAPVHGLVALSQATTVFADLQTLFQEMAPTFAREEVYTGYLFTSMSTNAVVLEPVFYWPDSRHALIDATMERQHLARLPVLPDKPSATALVAQARQRVIEIFTRHGCGHFQIGRSYPYRQSRDAAAWDLLEAVKTALDPTAALNPGGLGFDVGAAGGA